jgi:hypothetical protein
MAMRRNADYVPCFEPGNDYGFSAIVDGEGAWLYDQNKGTVWVDTGTKHGVLCFGQQQHGYAGYWHDNPRTPGGPPYDAVTPRDPCAPLGSGNGPKASEHYMWLRIFNPDHFAEVFAGKRVPWADTYDGKPGMRTAYEVNMRTSITNGANIPSEHAAFLILGDIPAHNALIPPLMGPDTDQQGAVWDARAGQIIWAKYRGAPGAFAVNFFTVS